MLMVAGNEEETLEICVSSMCKYVCMFPNVHGGQRRALSVLLYHFWPCSLAAVCHWCWSWARSQQSRDPLLCLHSSGVTGIVTHWTISPVFRGECFQGYISTVLVLCSWHPSLSLTSLKHINNLTVFWQKISHPQGKIKKAVFSKVIFNVLTYYKFP